MDDTIVVEMYLDQEQACVLGFALRQFVRERSFDLQYATRPLESASIKQEIKVAEGLLREMYE